jgi:hypothetical protein
MGFCAVPDCYREAHSGDLCQGHGRRKARGRPVASSLREPRTRWGRLTEAAIAFTEAPTDDDVEFLRRARQLRRAAQAYSGPPVQTPAYGGEAGDTQTTAPEGAEEAS